MPKIMVLHHTLTGKCYKKAIRITQIIYKEIYIIFILLLTVLNVFVLVWQTMHAYARKYHFPLKLHILYFIYWGGGGWGQNILNKKLIS